MIGTKELAKRVADKVGFTATDTETVVRTLVETMLELISEGEVVRLQGIGKLFRQYRPMRKWCDPNTGEKTTLPGRMVIKFKAATTIKGKINE